MRPLALCIPTATRALGGTLPARARVAATRGLRDGEQVSGVPVPGVDLLDRPARRPGESHAQLRGGAQPFDVLDHLGDVPGRVQHGARLVREDLGDLPARTRDERDAGGGILEDLQRREVEQRQRRGGGEAGAQPLRPAGARPRGGRPPRSATYAASAPEGTITRSAPASRSSSSACAVAALKRARYSSCWATSGAFTSRRNGRPRRRAKRRPA